MSEFSLINKFCLNIGEPHPRTRLSVGDDAALVSVPNNMELAISVDTMVEDVHFLAGNEPAVLAHKLLAVNVSDMAAMGARACWATLALTLPSSDEAWLQSFSAGLNEAATYYGVELIGGDTTAGPLTLSLQIMGLVKQGHALKRSGAKPGDVVCVTGTLGDAALALQLGHAADVQLLKALQAPRPPFTLGPALIGLATSAIDISDGLVADLAHIARASGVSLLIECDELPLSDQYRLAACGYDSALYGGDDYQLAFTLPATKVTQLQALAKANDTRITPVGSVTEVTSGPVLLLQDGQLFSPSNRAGFDHFQNND